MKKIMFVLGIFLSTLSVRIALAQKQQQQTVTIKTSAECEMCKKKIEQLLLQEKGIKNATVNLATKEVMVTYDERKTTNKKIYNVISNAGYDADTIPANNKALQQLYRSHKK